MGKFSKGRASIVAKQDAPEQDRRKPGLSKVPLDSPCFMWHTDT